jgi:hypothetical protein
MANKKAFSINSFREYLVNEFDAEVKLKWAKSKTLEMMRHTTVFADLFSSEREIGKLKKFELARMLDQDLRLEQMKSFPEHVKITQTWARSIRIYAAQIEIYKEWLSYMCILERIILQQDSFINPKLSFRLLKQQSGSNTYNYIVIRAPFYDIIKGNIEVRSYFGKLEDYPDCKSILDVMKVKQNFNEEATAIIRKTMTEQMQQNSMQIDEIETGVQELIKKFTS